MIKFNIAEYISGLTKDNYEERINSLFFIRVMAFTNLNKAIEINNMDAVAFYEKINSKIRLASMVLREYKNTYGGNK